MIVLSTFTTGKLLDVQSRDVFLKSGSLFLSLYETDLLHTSSLSGCSDLFLQACYKNIMLHVI